MKSLVIFFLITSLLLPIPTFAAIQTVTHTIQQPFGGSQSPDDARIAGIARAKREALEQFGTYIESTTIVKNSQVSSDEILALTAGVTKADVIKQKNYTDGDAFGMEITVKVELDTAVLETSLKRLLQDRNHLKDLTTAREREKKLLARVAELEKENLQKGKTEQQSAILKEEFKTSSRGLTTILWFYKAMSLWDGKKYSDPQKAVEYLTQAIQLEPNFVTAYNNRGVAYNKLNQIELAITDFNQAISLDSNDAALFFNRGTAYNELKQFDRAIADFDQAIRIDSNYSKAFNNRGIIYHALKQFERAIVDFDQAIRLNPNCTDAYFNRGCAYHGLKNFNRAISDFDQAIRLDPNDFVTFNKRGIAYDELKQFDRAIASYDQTIRLDPNNVIAYNNRGINYVLLNKIQKGCSDLAKACTLGACNSYEQARQDKLCR